MCVFVWQTQRHDLCVDCLLFVSYLEGFLSLVHSKVATTGILSERRFSAIVLMVVFDCAVRPNGPWHTIKPRIEMCTTPKRNKKNQICVTDLFIYLTSSSVLFCLFFSSFSVFDPSIQQEDAIAERTQSHPAVRTLRQDYEEFRHGHVSFEFFFSWIQNECSQLVSYIVPT